MNGSLWILVSLKSLKLGGLNLDCNYLSLKRKKVTWPTTDPEAWSQSGFGKTKICRINTILIKHLIWYHLGRNENMEVTREIVK